ncbi:LamG domain-containing protein [Bythopirellula polymerisocia]|uniref:LamG-like jellyroll fold domain-containing protein n=1 Tax=Bythopirellula polymerisocia TaxID=2528003 RepID=A0A5C6CVK1_9BACT|nr:LamG domain-containing protein [Bythopirellula polymerisocia]TWU28478.1 hypothetical protein Pla144_17680 [Bythopirellula polymerisocia]
MYRICAITIALLLITLPSEVSAAPVDFQLAIQDDNPLLWYQLAEGTGQAVNFGSLGSAYNATYHGTVGRQMPTSSGDAGVEFDSIDDFLESLGSSPLVGNPTFSIETLIFFPVGGAAGLWGPYLHWGDGGGVSGSLSRTGQEVYFGAQNTNLNRVYTGFYNGGKRTQNTVPLGEWLHLVWTRQGGVSSDAGSTLYVNGLPVPLEQDPNLTPGFIGGTSIDVTSTPFRINRGRDFVDLRHFDGTMDEIALYDRVLTPQEVIDHTLQVPGMLVLGDYDQDGDVDGHDFLVWQRGGSPNGTGSGDLALWQAQYGTPVVAASTAVPEPSNWVFLLFAAVGGVFSRKR